MIKESRVEAVLKLISSKVITLDDIKDMNYKIEVIKSQFNSSILTRDNLDDMVRANDLTIEDYEEITGETFV